MSRLLAVKEDTKRNRLSVTEAGQYVRIVMNGLPKHIQALQDVIIANESLYEGLGIDRLSSISKNLNKIVSLIYDQLLLLDEDVKKPVEMPIPEEIDAVVSIMEQQLFTLPAHVKKLRDAMDPENIEGKEGLDWEALESPVNLDRIGDLINDNNSVIALAKQLLPEEALKELAKK
eukprot:TRINITY_DN1597_c0_g1_i2.p2 TRINITY_DN1597_c0_g1~~TRINITY_DN1597_c0_g1_i2.p2  ORF type:complete len:187 (+),score=74.46 TRINITY_DN1597_c0_g1_i2:37-561(+)